MKFGPAYYIQVGIELMKFLETGIFVELGFAHGFGLQAVAQAWGHSRDRIVCVAREHTQVREKLPFKY